jgi:hypothetical protein
MQPPNEITRYVRVMKLFCDLLRLALSDAPRNFMDANNLPAEEDEFTKIRDEPSDFR